MVWWRTFLLALSLVLAGPLPVSAASAAAATAQTADAAAFAAHDAEAGPCHQAAATESSAPACCAGQDMAAHCGTAACAASCTLLIGPPECPRGATQPARAGLRPELPVPRGRSVAPEEPPPTA